MRPPRNEKINLDDEPYGPDASRHGRLRTEKLRTVLGEVADLSASGLRLCCKGKCRVNADQQLELKLQALEEQVVVTGRVVWTSKTGFRRYELGVEFVDLTDEQKRQLLTIARTAVDSCVMAQEH